MIQIIPLIKESISTYKLNFKKIFLMVLPVIVLSYIMSVSSASLSAMVVAGTFDGGIVAFFILGIIAAIFSALLFVPALNRAIQRNEDTNSFDTKEAYSFQKRNIWKYIKLVLWGFVYMLKRLLPYLLASLVLAAIIFFVSTNEILSLVLASLATIVLFVGIILNIPQFVLYKTIFFSKEILARDSVRESMDLGVKKTKQVWKLILDIIIVSIVVMLFAEIINYFAGLMGTGAWYIAEAYIKPIITLVVATPMVLILVAKGYTKIRG